MLLYKTFYIINIISYRLYLIEMFLFYLFIFKNIQQLIIIILVLFGLHYIFILKNKKKIICGYFLIYMIGNNN